MSADHPLIGLEVRVSPGSEPFDGVIAAICADGRILVVCSGNRLYRADPGTVTLLDPERAARLLRARTASQDLTTDGRTLSQVCMELVEAKQSAARLNDALQDLAVDLGLPWGLPERSLLAAIRAKVAPEYTPPRWVPAKDVAVGTSYLAAVHPDGQTIADCDSGVPLTEDDRDAYVAMNLMILVGEWPPLPKEGT